MNTLVRLIACLILPFTTIIFVVISGIHGILYSLIDKEFRDRSNQTRRLPPMERLREISRLYKEKDYFMYLLLALYLFNASLTTKK